MKTYNKAFGTVIRKLRKKRNLSQETLGFCAQLDRTYISLIELGNSSPTLDTIVALAAALGLSVTALLAATEKVLAGEDWEHE